MVISQGDICWASLNNLIGSGAGFRRPVVIVQGDSFNASRISTTVVIPLTSNQRLSASPGNFGLPAATTGLPSDSVANVSQIVAIDREPLTERVGRLPGPLLSRIFAGIDLVLEPRLRRSARVAASGAFSGPTGGGLTGGCAAGSVRGCCRSGLEHDACGDSAGFEVSDRVVDLVERSRFADHSCLAGRVKLEHLA